MIGSFTAAARLPQTDRDHAALIGDAEGQAAVAVLTRLSGSDWQRPTDCTEWDVRALVSHLVGECEDGLRLRTSLRRELAGRRRYPGKASADAHMAVQVDDHRAKPGPELAERFALLWPRAVQARRRRACRGAVDHTQQRPPWDAPVQPRLPVRHHLQPGPMDAPPGPGPCDRAAIRHR